jgi:class 3 adenylate cyclase/tetratricopeptide (TPR) repeat protein
MTEHRKLAAIMFSDITGYSALMSKDEKHAMDVLVKNRNIHKAAIAMFSGQYIKEIGDGTLAIFQSSLDAVSCAIKIMRSCRKDASFSVRIGIHIGDIVFQKGDVFGEGVNIASRIEAAGKPEGIYISERVYEDIKNRHEIKTEFIEEKTLKNIDHPVKIYSIDPDASIPGKRRSSALSRRISTHWEPDSEKKVRIPKLWLFFAISALILITVVAFLWFILPGQKPESPENRIVVALFENRTGDASLEELGTMAADWITQGLSQAEEANVVPTTTVIQLSSSLLTSSGKIRQSDYLEKLAEMTKAGLVVSGLYYLQQDQLQFQAEVKNVKEGSIVYAFPAITGPVQQPMELIEKLSSEIIGGLTFHLRWQDIRCVSKAPNKDAYREYTAGLELFGRDYKTATLHFMQAVKMDSLFLAPQFYIASAYSSQGDYSRADSVFKLIGRKRELLTPYERHIIDANITNLNGSYTESMRHLRLAENISPGDIALKFMIGSTALRLNKPGITIETCAKFEVPPSFFGSFVGGAWWITNITDAYHLLGDYDSELAEARKGQQNYPDWFMFYSSEVRALSSMGRTEEIKMVIDRCYSISSQNGTAGDVITTAALELRAHGHAQEAQKYALQAVEWYRNRPAHLDNRRNLAYALYNAEMWQDAQNLYEQLAAESTESIEYQGYLGTLAARLGEREQATNISVELKQINRPYLYGQHTYWRACIASQLGEQEEAVQLLQESFSQGRRYSVYLHSTIDFEPLKDYPPYKELLKPKE